MANWSLPVLTSTYANFLAEMKSRDVDIIKMLDGTTSSNLPSGAKRWNTTANKWEKYNGTSWSDLSTLYEIKVANSNKLNGQLASYYALANHTHTGYAATNHTHSEYAATGHNHNSAYLGISAKAADSSFLNGKAESVNAGANTIGLRDASGDFFSRLFRSTYAEQTGTPASTAHICFRNNASSDNYMRFMTGSAFKNWLTAIGVATTDTNTWRGITDSVTTTSSTISASATAVKTAYDKGVEALNKANTAVTNVGTATAGLAVGSVGSYAMLYREAEASVSQGATVAGSSLYYSNASGDVVSGSPAGTWRCMGRTNGGALSSTSKVSIWLRIA